MMEKERFRSYTLDEDKPDDIITTIRLNPDEQEALEKLKEILDVKSDAKALKFAALISLNVIQHTFGPKMARYLFKNERQRLSDYKNF